MGCVYIAQLKCGASAVLVAVICIAGILLVCLLGRYCQLRCWRRGKRHRDRPFVAHTSAEVSNNLLEDFVGDEDFCGKSNATVGRAKRVGASQGRQYRRQTDGSLFLPRTDNSKEARIRGQDPRGRMYSGISSVAEWYKQYMFVGMVGESLMAADMVGNATTHQIARAGEVSLQQVPGGPPSGAMPRPARREVTGTTYLSATTSDYLQDGEAASDQRYRYASAAGFYNGSEFGASESQLGIGRGGGTSVSREWYRNSDTGNRGESSHMLLLPSRAAAVSMSQHSHSQHMAGGRYSSQAARQSISGRIDVVPQRSQIPRSSTLRPPDDQRGDPQVALELSSRTSYSPSEAEAGERRTGRGIGVRLGSSSRSGAISHLSSGFVSDKGSAVSSQYLPAPGPRPGPSPATHGPGISKAIDAGQRVEPISRYQPSGLHREFSRQDSHRSSGFTADESVHFFDAAQTADRRLTVSEIQGPSNSSREQVPDDPYGNQSASSVHRGSVTTAIGIQPRRMTVGYAAPHVDGAPVQQPQSPAARENTVPMPLSEDRMDPLSTDYGDSSDDDHHVY